MIKKIAWETFKNTGDIDTFLEFKQIENIENNIKEIQNALNIFKSKIKFTYEPIPEIFKQISGNTSKNVSKLFKNAVEKMETDSASVAFEKSVDEYAGNLNMEDKQAIKSLSKLLRNNG